jgi:hypothetical protein
MRQSLVTPTSITLLLADNLHSQNRKSGSTSIAHANFASNDLLKIWKNNNDSGFSSFLLRVGNSNGVQGAVVI